MAGRLARWAAGVIGAALVSAGVARPAAAADRPNVVLILADDMGFSDVGCYGGEIHTPNVDGLAKQGVRFAQFYNMARCCPTRASLMTGLYPHQAGIGAMNQREGKSPSYAGELNDRCATMAEVLKDSGYHTGMVGKWHLCHLTISEPGNGGKAKSMLDFKNDAPISPEKTNWPCNRGFEQHWGTIPGVDNYYDPYGLVHNEQTIKPDKPDFYYTDFITDHAVGLIDDYAADNATKPFFLYVAYTAPHWPMQAREADVAKYASTYSVGWDAIRQARFDRQVEMGLCKREWGLSPRAFLSSLNDGDSKVGPWDKAEHKDWQARRMAVYAAMVECMDRGVGRILGELSAKQMANTVVVFLSDNGACQENVNPGWYDIPTQTRDGRKIRVGNTHEAMPGPETVYQSYGPAWANASNTPLRRFKHFTEEGGISAPFIVRWPGQVGRVGEIDHDQVGHVIDLMPTVLAAAGATYPTEYHGHAIVPEEGINLLPVFKGGPKIDRGPLCWEHEGNRAVRMGDWKMIAAHGEPWKLYNIPADRTEAHDLSAEHPDKVAELHAAYDAWVKRVGVEEWPIRD